MEQARQIIEAALAAGRNTLSEYESKRLLAAYHVPVTKEELISDLDAAKRAADGLGYPVVLKVCSEQVPHKTEKGLIQVGIEHQAELEQAFARLAGQVPQGGGILVQEMLTGKRELVAGLTRDPGFGPCVMLGLGGIFSEVLADVSFRVAPLTDYDVSQMIEELRSRKLLTGFRGMPEVNLEVLTQCITALSRIGLDHPEVKEIDLNPLIVYQGKPVAADALVVLEQADAYETAAPKAKESLEPFFSPKSVAVIGASAIPHKSGNDVVLNILANQYQGDLHLVNPKGGEIEGHKVSCSIADLPQGVDLAIIILPAKANPQAIRDCAAQGVKAVVLAAGGFAEVDEEGKALQEETVRAIEETGVRVIGPNTSGHTSTPANFTSSFFPLGKIPRGNISYIAQTGNFATHTMRYIMSAENYGVARVVGLGNKLDVEESEVLEYLAEDRETKAIFMYLESFKKPRRFLEVASQVTRVKPVVVLKGGATAEGADAAVAHTAALASDDRIIDAALKQAGVVRIYKYSHLFLAAKALAAMPLPKGNRVSFSAPSGAMLVCMSDFCRRQLCLEVPRFEEATRKRLQEISPPFIRMRNPVDIWPAATVKGVEFAYREATECVLKDPNIDAVVPIIMLTTQTGAPPLDFLLDLAAKYPTKPIYLTFSGEKKHMEAAKAFLEPKGVPTFTLIEEPFEVLSILTRCRQAMERPGDSAGA